MREKLAPRFTAEKTRVGIKAGIGHLSVVARIINMPPISYVRT